MGAGKGSKGGYKNEDAEGISNSVASLEPDPRYSGCCSNIFRPGRVVRDLIVGALAIIAIAVVIAVVFVVCFFFIPTKTEENTPVLGEEGAFHGEPIEDFQPIEVELHSKENNTRYDLAPQLERVRLQNNTHGHDHHHHEGHKEHHHVGPVPEPEPEAEAEAEPTPEPEPEPEPEPSSKHTHGKGPLTHDHTHPEMDHDHTHPEADHNHTHPDMDHDHTHPAMDHDHTHLHMDHDHTHPAMDHDHSHPAMEHDHTHPHMNHDHTHPAMDHEHTHPEMDHNHTHPDMDHDHTHPAMDHDHTHPHMDHDHTHPHIDHDHTHPEMDHNHTHPEMDHNHTHPRMDHDHTHHHHDHTHPEMDHNHTHTHDAADQDHTATDLDHAHEEAPVSKNESAMTHEHTHGQDGTTHGHAHPERKNDHGHHSDLQQSSTTISKQTDTKAHHHIHEDPEAEGSHVPTTNSPDEREEVSLPPLFELFSSKTPAKEHTHEDSEGTLKHLEVPHENTTEVHHHEDHIEVAHNGTEEPTTEPTPEGVCQPRKLEMCADLPHALTTFPNWAGDKTEADLQRTSLPFMRDVIVRSRCSPRAKEYSCAILEPPCNKDGEILPPCRTFCKSVASTCQEFITSRFSISAAFDCDQFPDSSDPSVCLDMTQEAQADTDHSENRAPEDSPSAYDTNAPSYVPTASEDHLGDYTEAGLDNETLNYDYTYDYPSDFSVLESSHDINHVTQNSPQSALSPTCSQKEFGCVDGSLCLPLEEVCDGIQHCGDGSDERGCQDKDTASPDNTTTETLTTEEAGATEVTQAALLETTTFLPMEETTIKNTCPELQCLDGTCISLAQVNDGVVDCPNGIDEEDFGGLI